MTKHWVLLTRKNKDIIEQLLTNRKIKKEDWDDFLNPDFEKIFNPFWMKGMKEAVERIKKACQKKETIGIFGDYDADGIPGAALLYDYLTKIGLKVFVYIPMREEGYGLNRKGIEVLKKEGATLLITIDLGIRNVAEVKFAQKLGFEVIILDHHELIGRSLPCLVLNPKQKRETYPFRELSATGVVFKFVQAINQKLKKVSENYLKWFLDLVAISTICDIVPLISENRIFAKYGLIVLEKTKRVGLQELFKIAAITPENIGAYTVGFQIGPRLNAPGRLDHANESFYLLTSRDRDEARILAEKLNTINRRRQDELARVLREAKEEVARQGLEKKKVIMVAGKNWPSGIVGLVAGKLMEEFARPVIVCEEKNGRLRGSARSIDAYNIVDALNVAKEYLLKYGGHKRAAGLSLEQAHLSNLYDKLSEIAESKLRDEDLVPKITIDAKVTAVELDLDLFDKIKKFEPFGLGNPRPVFLIGDANIGNIRAVGQEGKHLKLTVDGISAIGFDLGFEFKDLREGTKADIVFTLDEDNWDGTRKLQLKVLDLKMC